MNIKGIDYDLGVSYLPGICSRPTFKRAQVRREIEIIKNDLHCNAIRLNGTDLERLAYAGECAISQGLQVWMLPKYVDACAQDALLYLAECARMAEKLRQRSPEVILIAGCELTLFLNGILQGANIIERIGIPANWEFMRRGDHNQPLNEFLDQAVTEIRRHFHGPLAYASVPLEKVDWNRFNYVGLDHYREARTRGMYREILERSFSFGKPVIVTEFGCCAYQGAADRGGRGWEVIDQTATPPQLKEALTRDESAQANELIELLRIFDAAKVAGAFAYTFAAPAEYYNENPLFDFDMANYGLVTNYADRAGATYAGLPWEPKQAFHALANYYAEN
jgi:hypothetical protein